MAETVSISAFARLKGVSRKAVYDALDAGRIEREADGRIDPDKALKDWDKNTAPRRGGVTKGNRPREPRRDPGTPERNGAFAEEAEEAEEAEDTASTASTPTGGRMLSMAQATAAVRTMDAHLRQLKFRQLAGTVVDRDRANRVVFAFFRMVRDGWTSWPARVSPRLTAELTRLLTAKGEITQRDVNLLLEQYVHEHLTELSNNPPPRF